MRVYLAADHRGYYLRDKVKEYFEDKGVYVKDFGNDKYDREDDYVDFAVSMGEAVVREGVAGIAICGSGVGMDIILNKVKGVRSALCTTVRQAYLAKNDDNANVLVLSADLIDPNTNLEIVEKFINSVFSSEERHIRRLKKIENYELEASK